MNYVLGDRRLEVIRSSEERLKLRRGVRSLEIEEGFHCGSARDLVIAQLMPRVSRKKLNQRQREFLMASLFHTGLLGLRPCQECRPLLRLICLYERWWQERIVLERWERVSNLDPERMRGCEIEQIAFVVQCRLEYMQAVQTRYDPATGKLHY